MPNLQGPANGKAYVVRIEFLSGSSEIAINRRLTIDETIMVVDDDRQPAPTTPKTSMKSKDAPFKPRTDRKPAPISRPKAILKPAPQVCKPPPPAIHFHRDRQ